LTRKNPSPYDLYCVGGTLSQTQSINQCLLSRAWLSLGAHSAELLTVVGASSSQKSVNRIAYTRLSFIFSAMY